MLISTEIDSALNFFQFISFRSCKKMHFVHYGKTRSHEKWNWRVWKFPAYHGSWEYFQMLTSNILVLEFFVQKQRRIQGVVGTTPHPPAPVAGQENDAAEADHTDLALDDNDVFFLSSCASSYIGNHATFFWRYKRLCWQHQKSVCCRQKVLGSAIRC